MATSKMLAWFAWTIASIFYAYQYILRVMPNIMLHDIMQQFHINTAIFGQFSGVYYIGYALMHLPIGIMLDRYGPKKIMTICILLSAVGLLPIIFAGNWVYAIIGRALMGIGSSAAILGIFKIVRMTFSEVRFTRMLSLAVTIGLLGAIYGGGPVSYMCNSLGYKMVVEIFIVIGLLLAGITYLIVPEAQSKYEGAVIANMQTVFANRKVMALCLFAGLMVGPLEGFADVWGSAFLTQVYGFDKNAASYLPFIIFMGMCFGGPILSLITEKTGNYIACITIAGIIMTVSFIALLAGVLSKTSMAISFIIIGICSAYQILVIYKASTFVPKHMAGLTTAIANMIIMIFGYAFHTVISFVINAQAATNITRAFIYGVGVIPLALGIGSIGFLVLTYQEKRSLSRLSR